jgi:phosphate transport system permease protein
MLNAITGTLLIVILASIVGMPLGIGSGVYLSRSQPHAFSHAVRFFMDVIAGTPSIVAGVVAYAVLVIPFHHFSAFSGGIALALLMFPTVGRATEEAIRLVPGSIREGALALGIQEWKTMLRIILPAASPGIITAVMLGIARVAGETAPLLFTAFGNPGVSLSPNSPAETLPLQIWTYATSPYEDWHRQAWAGAFVLFVIIVVLNLTARVLTRHMASQMGRG